MIRFALLKQELTAEDCLVWAKGKDFIAREENMRSHIYLIKESLKSKDLEFRFTGFSQVKKPLH